MADTTIPNPTEEVAVSHPLSTTTIARLGMRPEWVTGKSCRAILSAAGHPGYGESFARRVLLAVEQHGEDIHAVIYGAVITGPGQ